VRPRGLARGGAADRRRGPGPWGGRALTFPFIVALIFLSLLQCFVFMPAVTFASYFDVITTFVFRVRFQVSFTFAIMRVSMYALIVLSCMIVI